MTNGISRLLLVLILAGVAGLAILLVARTGDERYPEERGPTYKDVRDPTSAERVLTRHDWERGIRMGRRYWAGECGPIKLRYRPLANHDAYAYPRTCTIVLDPDELRPPSLTLQGIAVHEVGHLAGCGHQGPESIMHPRVSVRRSRFVGEHFARRHSPHRC